MRAWASFYTIYLLVATRVGPSALRYLMLAVLVTLPFPELVHSSSPRFSRSRGITFVGVLVAFGLMTQYRWVQGVYTIAVAPEKQPFP
jgi:hypothetical protein